MSASRPPAPTVVTVVGGETRAPSRSFPLGSPVLGFSVGAQADWAIVASGVAPVHLYLSFDGRDVHVAPADPNARVFLDGRELGAGWHAAAVGCELRFGAVCLLVTNEALRGGTQPLHPAIRPGEPAQQRGQLRTQILAHTATAPAAPAGRSEPPPPAEGSRPPMAGFAPVQPAPHVQGARGAQGVQPAGGGAAPAPGHPLTATAQWHTPAVAMDARRASSPPPAANREQQVPAAANIPKIQPARMVPLGGLDQTVVSPHAQVTVQPAVRPAAVQVVAAAPPPAQVAMPPAAQVFAAGPPAMPMLAPAEAPPGAAGAAPSNSAESEGDSPLTSTLGDGGALRAHAGRVAEATPSAAYRSGEAYADEVRRASGPTPAAGRPPEVPAPEAPPVASRFSFASSWRAASLPKKLTLVLLPFALAGFMVILDDQPAPAPARVKKVASAHPSASALAASSALAAAASSASAVAAASAPAPGLSGSPPSAVISVGRPSASALTVAGPASSVGASIIEVGSAAASSAAAPRSSYAAAERDAINAAFEGRNAEAARLYERLSSAQQGRVFALAAHLVRDNIVLKPAISH